MGLFGNKQPDEMAQVEQNINQVEMDIQNKIFEMGQHFLNENRDNANLDEYYVKTIDFIKKLEQNRKGFYANKLRLQGLMMCQNCGTVIPFGSVFCSACGNKADERVEGANITEEQDAQKTEKVCSKCGAKAESDAGFCALCGNKL